ncbi:hypothetical protein PG989_010809 [Apiospora arundinis]
MTIPQDLIYRGMLSASGPNDGDDSVVGGMSGHHGDIPSPLPQYLRSGLIAIAFFGFLSLVSATGLFVYISYRLLRWHLFFKHQQSRRRSLSALEDHCNSSRPTQADIPDYTLGLPQLGKPPISARYPQQRNSPGSIGGTTFTSPGCSTSRSRSPSPCPSFSDYHHQYEQHHHNNNNNDGSTIASTTRGYSSDGRKGKRKHQHRWSSGGHKRHISSSSTNTTRTTSSLSAEVATNPFLLLIYNLLLADMIQATSFLLSVSWLRYDATYSGSVTCWMQGWLSMTGKLSASACLVFASGLTYLTVVRGYRASPRALYAAIAGVWLFTYVLAGAGVAITHNGREGGGWFAWSNGWCWVNSNYRDERFWLGYFWIFLSVGLTILIYGAIFAAMLRRKKLSWRHMPDPDSSSLSSSSPINQRNDREQQRDPHNNNNLQRFPSNTSGSIAIRHATPPRPSGHHPVFLVYPFIYLVVTGPLATGRMMTMAGYGVSMTFYLFAGALSAAHGFLNVVLWSTCILLMGAREQEELGLDRFMRTPKERTYGNMVWIQGGNGPSVGDGRGSVGGTVRRGSWAQRLFGRVGSVGGGGGGNGGQTIWHSTTTAKVRPWGAGAAATDSSSKYSLNRHTTGPSEAGGGGTNNNNSSNETTEMQILTTVTIETSGNGTTERRKSVDS